MGFDNISDDGHVVERRLLHDRLREVAQLHLHLFLLGLGPVPGRTSDGSQTLEASGEATGDPLDLGLELSVELPRGNPGVASPLFQVDVGKPDL